MRTRPATRSIQFSGAAAFSSRRLRSATSCERSGEGAWTVSKPSMANTPRPLESHAAILFRISNAQPRLLRTSCAPLDANQMDRSRGAADPRHVAKRNRDGSPLVSRGPQAPAVRRRQKRSERKGPKRSRLRLGKTHTYGRKAHNRIIGEKQGPMVHPQRPLNRRKNRSVQVQRHLPCSPTINTNWERHIICA